MTGTVIRIIGAVLDIAFPVDAIPPIHNLVYVLDDQHGRKVPCEVVQHLPGAVRCVSRSGPRSVARPRKNAPANRTIAALHRTSAGSTRFFRIQLPPFDIPGHPVI